MPTATITPSIDVEALTLIGIKAAKETRDALKVAPGVLAGFEGALGKTPKRWEDGSDRWTNDIQVVEHTAATNFQTGFESYDESALAVSRQIAFGLAISGVAAKMGERQFRIYKGPRLEEQVKKLSTNCVGILHRGWCKRLVAATGTGFADFATFNGFDSTAGFFESAAKASQTNTVGGFNKGTWAATAPGATNAVADLSNAFGTNFNNVYAMLSQIERVKPVSMGKKFGLMSESFRNNYKRYMQAYERWGAKDEIDGGKVVEVFQGIKFYLDTFMPDSGATTATNVISAYVIDAEDCFPVWAPATRVGPMEMPDGFFGAGEWRPVNGLQNVLAMPFACSGNVPIALFGSSGVVRRGNTY
ncbi:MAG: hypothetical protein FJ090_19860 [Deltaproteobacteria bacterium]|nr:hypothetical protein [Deltaproteobacteria bacterium]